jgi:hypothetical protein
MGEMKKLVPEGDADYEAFLKRYFPHEWQMKAARGEFGGKGGVRVKRAKGKA